MNEVPDNLTLNMLRAQAQRCEQASQRIYTLADQFTRPGRASGLFVCASVGRLLKLANTIDRLSVLIEEAVKATAPAPGAKELWHNTESTK